VFLGVWGYLSYAWCTIHPSMVVGTTQLNQVMRSCIFSDAYRVDTPTIEYEVANNGFIT
jgi:hypothetical protein